MRSERSIDETLDSFPRMMRQNELGVKFSHGEQGQKSRYLLFAKSEETVTICKLFIWGKLSWLVFITYLLLFPMKLFFALCAVPTLESHKIARFHVPQGVV